MTGRTSAPPTGATVAGLVISCLLSTAATAAAAGPFEAVFGAHNLETCFYRAYDAAHLGGHPQQLTSVIEVDMEPPGGEQQPFTSEHFELGVGVVSRKSKDWYTANASCTTSGAGFSCQLDAGGGEFMLAPQADGGMELTTKGLKIEGDPGFLELGQGKSDDTKFLLQPAEKSLCDAATADVRGE